MKKETKKHILIFVLKKRLFLGFFLGCVYSCVFTQVDYGCSQKLIYSIIYMFIHGYMARGNSNVYKVVFENI